MYTHRYFVAWQRFILHKAITKLDHGSEYYNKISNVTYFRLSNLSLIKAVFFVVQVQRGGVSDNWGQFHYIGTVCFKRNPSSR
jgi:hypothetical protein